MSSASYLLDGGAVVEDSRWRGEGEAHLGVGARRRGQETGRGPQGQSGQGAGGGGQHGGGGVGVVGVRVQVQVGPVVHSPKTKARPFSAKCFFSCLPPALPCFLPSLVAIGKSAGAKKIRKAKAKARHERQFASP